MTDQVPHQLNQGLAVSENSGFQRVAEDCVRNDESQDGRDPSGQKNRKDDLKTFETVAASFRHCVSQLMPAGCEDARITVTLLSAPGKDECLHQRLLELMADY
jgi:hypothetical protein